MGSWVLPLSLYRLIRPPTVLVGISKLRTSSTNVLHLPFQLIFKPFFGLRYNMTCMSVQGYTSKEDPLVCTGFTSDFNTTVNKTITRPLYGYPTAFAILSYLGLSVDVAAAILLFTYAAFAEMRTFYGKLFINFAVVLLMGDFTFLSPLSRVEYDEKISCPRQSGINKSKESKCPCYSHNQIHSNQDSKITRTSLVYQFLSLL